MQDPDDLVERLAVHRVASERRVEHGAERLLGRHLDRDRHDLGTRHHHVGCLLVREVEHLVEHLALALLDLTVLGRDLEQHLELRLRVSLALVLRRVDPDRPLRELAGPLQEPDQGLEDEEEDANRSRHAERNAFRVAQRETLRHELADDDVQEGDDQEGEQHGDHRGEPCGEQVREHLLADGADRQRCQCDPELHRGDEMRRIARDASHRTCRPAALGRELLETRAAHGHQRVFGRDEEAVQENESGNAEELESDRHAPLPGAAVLGGMSSTTGPQYRKRLRHPRAAGPGRRARGARGGKVPRPQRTCVPRA